MLHSVYAHISVQETSIRSVTPFIIRQQDPNIQHHSQATHTIVCTDTASVHRHKINWSALSPPATLHLGMLQKYNNNRGQRTRMRVAESGTKAEVVQLQFFSVWPLATQGAHKGYHTELPPNNAAVSYAHDVGLTKAPLT